MNTSQQWFDHFSSNIKIERVNWKLDPLLTPSERKNILAALQAWQLGETSDGSHLLKATRKYAAKVNDAYYVTAVELFIKEEQKHGNNLGKYLDLLGEKRLKKNWADTLFRKVRYYNSSMELWTLAVIAVESTAQVFYQSLKDATGCKLLQQICTDILVDEAFHIDFQLERFCMIYDDKSYITKCIRDYIYKFSFFSISILVWITYRRCFKAGGNNWKQYYKKMNLKYKKTIGRMITAGGRKGFALIN